MDDRNLGEKFADIITRFGGSWKFIFVFSFFLSSWITINALAFFDLIAWDKPPYILLNLILSFIAAFQAPFIMMSQNRAEKKQDEAYRKLFGEIKEMVEQDIALEIEIKTLGVETKKQQTKLLEVLNQAIKLEQLTRQDLAEMLEYCYDKE